MPNGGGYTLTGMALSPTAAPPSYFVTLSNNFGKQTEHFDGVNITLNARLENGLLIQGGLGTGRQVTNDCEVVDDLPEMLHTFFGDPTRAFFFAARPREFCEQNNGFRTSIQGLAAYTIPKIDVQISGTLQNLPGAVVQANANYGVIPGVAGFGPFIPFQAFQIVAAGRAVRRAAEPDRLPRVEDLPHGRDSDQPELRLLQRDELQLHHRRELRVWPDVEAADSRFCFRVSSRSARSSSSKGRPALGSRL